MKIKDFYKSPKNWCQKRLSPEIDPNINAGVDLITETDREFNCLCLYGALLYCYGRNDGKISPFILQIEKEINFCLVAWNDDPKRKFKDVKNLVEKLDI